MANITKPAVERHSCDIAGCASMAENPMYWGVSFPVIAQDNYDDGSYFGGTRTRIINRTLDLCEHHAGTLLALHGQHTSNYGEAWTDDGPELQAHDARREQAEGRRAMTKVDKAVKQLNDSGIPAMRSSDPDYLVFEIGESVFRALLSADPTHAASQLIRAARAREGIIAGYRKTVAGLGRIESLPADDVFWDELFSNGEPVEIGTVIFQVQAGGDEHPVGLDLLVVSDGTWRPDGFDPDKEGAAGDVRDYLTQWIKENHEC